MSDFEFFSPSEGGESYDPAAFERFKQQVKKNAAFIAALRKGEQKQKKKEDRLAAILLKFIQSNQKRGILILAAKLLEENIPPSFILSVIVLGNEDIGEELRKEAELLNLPQPNIDRTTTEFSLMTKFTDESLPLKLKAEIDSWGKGMFEAASAVPLRMLETGIDKEGNVKKVIIDCAANVLSDFLIENEGPPIGYDTYFSFCEFIMKAIFKAVHDQITNQKEIGTSQEPL